MAQVIDSVPSNSDHICCCYVNVSSKIQVVRITNIANWYFERVAFPGQRLMFEAPSDALLEVHCGMMASSILSDTIPCDRLRLEDDAVVSMLASLDAASSSSEVSGESSRNVHELVTVSSSAAS